MNIALITGSAGLIGSEAVEFFAKKNFQIIGIDNNLRAYFFGPEASTDYQQKTLEAKIKNYIHHPLDIREQKAIEKIFKEYNRDIRLIIHTASQPSHDWAAKEPQTDFAINANGTLNLLEGARQYCPEVVFIFTSTNKVYGDEPNSLPLIEQEKRFDLPLTHPFYQGVDESMTIDQSMHSLFGASKLAADILVQEYGRYFGMKTVCFRLGCVTGANHQAAMHHGFLAYVMNCCMRGKTYTILGYQGKQVRDNIHSYDVVNAFNNFYEHPGVGQVYNLGGGRANSCSVLEAVGLCEKISGKKMNCLYEPQARLGDHQWYISSCKRFQAHYPQWRLQYDLIKTMEQINGRY